MRLEATLGSLVKQRMLICSPRPGQPKCATRSLSIFSSVVVEITSPSTEKRDLELKKNLYQSFGVEEYWVVLTEADTVERYLLEEDAYRLAGRFRDAIEFGGMEGVKVDLTKVW